MFEKRCRPLWSSTQVRAVFEDAKDELFVCLDAAQSVEALHTQVGGQVTPFQQASLLRPVR